jgi:hypothetical protein
MKQYDKDILSLSINNFSYLLDTCNYSIQQFANIIEHHNTSKQATEIVNVLRKYKGYVNKREIVVDLALTNK